MKTTLDISDDLLRRAKQAALDRNTTLRGIVEEALERALGPGGEIAPLKTVVWPPAASDGTPPQPDDSDWLAAIRRIRSGPADDPEWLARRMGVPVARRRRK